MKTSIKFKSFSSGSSGNCYFLGIFEEDKCVSSILIDAGVSPRRIKKELALDGIEIENIKALLVTHDHFDHIRSLGNICKHFNIPVWSSPELIKVLSRQSVSGTYLYNLRRELSPDWNTIVNDNIKVKYFIVPHDASQTIAFAIMLNDYKFVIMTDIGSITAEALSFAKGANTVVIESNYDKELLAKGPYPKELQDRISGGFGHLSNVQCAEAISQFDHPELKNVFLCHLSAHNNNPQLAHNTSRVVLRPEVRLVALPRCLVTGLFTL